VAKYRKLVNHLSVGIPKGAPPGSDCPRDEDVDWQEVAAGLWPELKARQLIMHAALCDHCGPLLRAAAAENADAGPEEEKLLAQLKTPARPDPNRSEILSPRVSWRFMRWLAPVMALAVIAGAIATKLPSTPLSGSTFADFAVRTHRRHAQGNLALDVRSDSQQALNDWLQAKSPFPVALPASPAAPGEERPYHLEGARLVRVGSKTAAYVAYQMQTGPVSLIVTPGSVAVASGGVQVDYKSVSFHYRTVEGYKVVTWSQHDLTYALVSQEGNSTQRSCMVCHSAMRDRDLSQIPSPIATAAKPFL
jgi:hypothetical protein